MAAAYHYGVEMLAHVPSPVWWESAEFPFAVPAPDSIPAPA